MLVWFGISLAISFFTPDALGIEVNDSYGDLTVLGEWMFSLSALAAMTLVLPFHSMAGFALYLNRRIELEAWDIEISFHNLANRKRAAAARSAGLLASLMLAAVVCLGLPEKADAATDHSRESASEMIEDVLQGEDFGQERTLRKWRIRDWSEEAEEDTIP